MAIEIVDSQLERVVKSSRRVVIKVGTGVLLNEKKALETGILSRFGSDVHALRSEGKDVVLVVSGSKGLQMAQEGISDTDLPEDSEQRDIEIKRIFNDGWDTLRQVYYDFFGHRQLAPVNVSRGDLFIPDKQEGLKPSYRLEKILADTLSHYLHLNKIPLVNENDFLAGEHGFKNNDMLAAKIANLINADFLLILSDIDGLHTYNPKMDCSKNPDLLIPHSQDLKIKGISEKELRRFARLCEKPPELVEYVDVFDHRLAEEIEMRERYIRSRLNPAYSLRPGFGSGGMVGKIEAILSLSPNIASMIANGKIQGIVREIFVEYQDMGTFFPSWSSMGYDAELDAPFCEVLEKMVRNPPGKNHIYESKVKEREAEAMQDQNSYLCVEIVSMKDSKGVRTSPRSLFTATVNKGEYFIIDNESGEQIPLADSDLKGVLGLNSYGHALAGEKMMGLFVKSMYYLGSQGKRYDVFALKERHLTGK